MKSSKWLARRGKTVRWRVPWTMDVFAFVRVTEMSAAHKAFWLPLSQQSDTASDLGLIRLSIHNRKTRHVEKLLEPLCWWYPSRFDNADSYLQQPHFLNLSLGALDFFFAIASDKPSWLTSTNSVWLPATWITLNCESQVAWTGRSRQTRRWYSWC